MSAATSASVEQWGVFEVALSGPTDGNPFTDVSVTATFRHVPRSSAALGTSSPLTPDVTGFYDGDGTYRIRFMPEATGEWSYVTHSNRPELDGRSGTFDVSPPSPNNRGPVRVQATYHFAYADGTPYRELGTTCYAWIHQTEALQEQTLRTLATSPFNKLRMCVFPKYYDWNHVEPSLYPFGGTPPNHWDFTRFNPAFFQHLEKRIADLRDLGIEADVILFHPYDHGHWGFDRMDPASDDRYLHYVVARLAAFRNVWWSLANEWDFMREKHDADWDRYFQIVQHDDPYGHLRSIHNGARIYDDSKPWVTHASIQSGAAVLDSERAMIFRDVYRKPVVFDEVRYEGNIPRRWGNLTGQELVLRFWEGLIAGTYVGHGETILPAGGAGADRAPSSSSSASVEPVLWWSKGGVLRGESPARLAFLKQIMDAMPRDGIDPIDKWQDEHTGGVPGEYYLVYFGTATPTSWTFRLYKQGLRDGMTFRVEILDTWNMTITPVDGAFITRKADDYTYADVHGRTIALPGKPYIALRIRRADREQTFP